jgi:cell division protein FtsQ
VFTMMLLAIALGGFGVWAVYGSNWLLVERVSVSGARHLTDQQVRQAAAVPTGEPVASVDRSAVERRVKKRLLRVAKAEAVRAWPHGIGLKVTERRAELVLKPGGPGAPYTEVDAEGVRFATVTTAPKGVPQLDMEEEQSSSVRHFGAARLRREAVRVASALPQRVAGDTETIRVRSYDSMTLDLKDGRSILWGSSERGAAKARVLTALMKASPEATHFDVSVPSAPASSES